MGRPSTYNQEIADKICEHLAEGYSLRSFCAREDAPNKSTVMRWLREHKEFRDQYARAREDQAEILADENLDIADDGSNDYVTRENKDGSTYEAIDHDHIARSRLRIDARKWFASKVAPKKYGERSITEITGKDGGPIETLDKRDDTDVARRLAFLLARGVRQVEKAGQ